MSELSFTRDSAPFLLRTRETIAKNHVFFQPIIARKSFSCNSGYQENALDRQIMIVRNYFKYENNCNVLKLLIKFYMATQNFK